MAVTKERAELMALVFLADHGPHTFGLIETEEAMCAVLIFLDLHKAGHASKTDFGGGRIQFAITDGGRIYLAESEA